MTDANAGGRPAAETSSFRRPVPADKRELLEGIERQRILLAQARARGDKAAELECMTAIGHQLFMSGRENEAAPLLDEALELARQRADRKAEIEVLLGLATARQYLGARKLAQLLFDEALMLCAETGFREQEHFLLHHRGRCFVEQREIAKAREAFAQALVLRKALGIQRFIDSTQAALDEMRGK